jgi:hypothetical protein
LAIGAVLFMFFAGVLRSRLREAGPEMVGLRRLGGAVIYTVGLGLFASSQFALLDAADVKQLATAQVLNVIDSNNFPPAVVGMTVVLLATGWHVLVSRSLPIWLGWVAVILGILALLGPLGFIAFLLFPFWVLAVAILLFRGGDAQPRLETP